jgi:hypothetical protein
MAAGEAMNARLLPGERAVLHGRTARALLAAGGEGPAEVAGHWQAAGRPAEELPARLAAAGTAERVFGYAQAAGHWLRASELWPDVPTPPAWPGSTRRGVHTEPAEHRSLAQARAAGRAAPAGRRHVAGRPGRGYPAGPDKWVLVTAVRGPLCR